MADVDQPGSLEPEAVPTPRIVGMPAPGKRGPAGLAPRTNYSKANTTPSPVGDGGAAEQKSIEPPKVAGMRATTMQEMVAGSLATALHNVKTAAQAGTAPSNTEQDKIAGVADLEDKVAAALEELADELEKAAEGDTHGSVATSPTTTGGGAKNPGPSGQGHAAHIPPHNGSTVTLAGNHSATSARVVDVTQPLAGPAPKMASELVNPLAKEARMEEDERVMQRAIGRAEKAGDKPAAKALKDRLWSTMGKRQERDKRQKAIVPAGSSAVEVHGSKRAPASNSNLAKASPTSATKARMPKIVDGILEDIPGGGRGGGGGGRGVGGHFGGHVPKQLPGPKGSRKGLIAGIASVLGAGGAAAGIARHHAAKVRASKIRKGVALGAAGAGALGLAGAAMHGGKETTASELGSGHIPKQLPRGIDSETTRRVLEGITKTPAKVNKGHVAAGIGGLLAAAGGTAAALKHEQKKLHTKNRKLQAGIGAAGLLLGAAAAKAHGGKETTASEDTSRARNTGAVVGGVLNGVPAALLGGIGAGALMAEHTNNPVAIAAGALAGAGVAGAVGGGLGALTGGLQASEGAKGDSYLGGMARGGAVGALLGGGMSSVTGNPKHIARGALIGGGSGVLYGALGHSQKEKHKEASDDPRVMDVLDSTSPGAGPTSLLSSNESATNFTRGQAYKNRVGELNKMLDESIGGSADTTLRQVLTSTSKADPKIAGVAQKTAADVLLRKMQERGGDVLLGILGGLK